MVKVSFFLRFLSSWDLGFVFVKIVDFTFWPISFYQFSSGVAEICHSSGGVSFEWLCLACLEEG